MTLGPYWIIQVAFHPEFLSSVTSAEPHIFPGPGGVVGWWIGVDVFKAVSCLPWGHILKVVGRLQDIRGLICLRQHLLVC